MERSDIILLVLVFASFFLSVVAYRRAGRANEKAVIALVKLDDRRRSHPFSYQGAPMSRIFDDVQTDD